MSIRFWNKLYSYRIGLLLGLLALSAFAFAACQSAPASAPAAAKPTTVPAAVAATTATTETSAAAAAGPLVMLHEDAKLGKILVDDKGMTLYVFDKDSKDKSACAGDCVVKWPLLLVKDESAKPTAGDGVSATLGVITRDDGTYQVTSNGLPLYYYFKDKQPNDTTGQAAGDVWWVVGADGNKITK